MMSVIVKTPDGKFRLICKGAPESVFDRCSRFELDDDIYPMDSLCFRISKRNMTELSADGFRVLAIAYRDCEPKPAYGKDDEQNSYLKAISRFSTRPRSRPRLRSPPCRVTVSR